METSSCLEEPRRNGNMWQKSFRCEAFHDGRGEMSSQIGSLATGTFHGASKHNHLVHLPHRPCEGSGDVVGFLTLLVGGVAQAFHDDRVVELRVQLGVEEVDGEGQGGTGGSRKGEASQRGAPMDMTVDDKVFAQDLSQ